MKKAQRISIFLNPKKLIALLCLAGIMGWGSLSAQGVAINTDNSNPDPSAMLDVKSTNQGLLTPRMTQAQRNLIASPATGLLIFQTNGAAGFYYYDGTGWVGAKSSTAFATSAGVTSNSPGTLATDHFVFGSTLLDDQSGSTDDKRMYFNKGKAAFRAGGVPDDKWDFLKVGTFSMAMGWNNQANGSFSASWGQNNVASGQNATAFGLSDTASGLRSTSWGALNNAATVDATAWGLRNKASHFRSTAFGEKNIASGENSTAFGLQNLAKGNRSTVWGALNNAATTDATSWGLSNTASGFRSTAFGQSNTANGENSTAFGSQNTASGNRATSWGALNSASNVDATTWGLSNLATGFRSTAFGQSNTASASNSTASGNNTFARSFSEFAVGMNSTDYTATSGAVWAGTDRVFVVGNGVNASATSDAFVVYKNGNATLSGTLTQNSDRRLKTNIKSLENALPNVLNIGGYSYNWKDTESRDAGIQIGVIAQEVQALYPELINTDGNGFLTVNYSGLVPVLIEATKAQQVLIDAQNITIDAQSARIQKLETEQVSQMSELKAQLDLLQVQMAKVQAGKEENSLQSTAYATRK